MARDFEASSSQYLECATTPVTTVDLSISAWIKPETVATSYICGVYDSGTDVAWFALRLGGAGPGVQASTSQTTDNSAVTSTSPSAGVWQHVCATFGPTGGTDRAVYLNGGGKGTNTTNRTPTSLDRVGIGVRSSATRAGYFDGLIAEVAIWSAQLTDAEVEALANRVHPLSVRSQALAVYWPLYFTGSIEPNLSSPVHNMSVVGATVSDEHPPVAPYPPADRLWVPYAVVSGPATVTGAAALSGSGSLTAVGSVRTPFASLTDTFATFDSAKWEPLGGTASHDTNRIKLPVTSSYASTLDSVARYDLTGSYVYAQLVFPAAGSGTREVTMELILDGNNKVFFHNTGSGSQRAYWRVGGVLDSAPLSGSDQWWRFREAGGTLYWDTSSDGSSWTNRHSMAAPIDVTDVYLLFNAGYWGTESASDAYVDNVNVVPGVVTGAAALSGAGTLSAAGVAVIPGAAALAGSGSLAAVGLFSAVGSATLSGSGTLSAVPLVVRVGDPLLLGTGTLMVVGLVERPAAASLSGAGTLSCVGTVGVFPSAALTGLGTLTASGYVVAYVSPVADVDSGGWSASVGEALYPCVDEAVASDADYIYSSPSPETPDVCELLLETADDPGITVGHAVHYRYRKSIADGTTVDLTVSLVQGTTVIASWQHLDVEDYETVRQELSEAEAGSIGNYSDLRVRFEAVVS